MNRDPELPNGFQDGDFEQRAFEDAGREYSRRERRYRALRAAGKLAEAAEACPHGSGYGSPSPAATSSHDPRATERGHRCTDCGSWFAGARSLFDLRDMDATVPCEIEVSR